MPGASSYRKTLYLLFELVAGVESHHATRLDGDRFTGARVASWTWRLGANLEISKAGNFDIIAIDQAVRDQIEKCIDHVFGFAFVQADLLKQQFSQVSLGQCRTLKTFDRKFHDTFLAISYCYVLPRPQARKRA